MTHVATCICVTCEVLRKRVPRERAKYAIDPDDMALAELHANAARNAFPEPVQRGYEVEQAERAQFEAWFKNCYGYAGDAWTSQVLQQCSGYTYSWRAWRARALL